MTCKLCGAAGHGNITCPVCRRNMKYLSDESRRCLKLTLIGYPLGTLAESPHVAIIKSVNRHIRKARAK